MNMPRSTRLTLMLANWRQQRHTASLRKRFPQIDRPLSNDLQQELAAEHAEYVASVSTASMAASLETATLLWRLCDAVKPTRLLDTGSGFSSFVLRRWAGEQEYAAVWSVDDDAQWLERTRAFLASRKLTDRGLMTWEAFAAQDNGPFDLVFHDMGTMATRIHSLPAVLRRVTPDTGVIVLDDTHNRKYVEAARVELKHCRATVLDAGSWTLDSFRRRATIACGLNSLQFCDAA